MWWLAVDDDSVWHRMHQLGHPWRFDVGTKVMCNTGYSGCSAGKIVALNFREDHWPPGHVAPYQVQLEDEGSFIFVPADDDRCIFIAEPLSKTGNRNRRARLAAKACKKAPMNSASDASARMLKTRLLEHGSGGGL